MIFKKEKKKIRGSAENLIKMSRNEQNIVKKDKYRLRPEKKYFLNSIFNVC